MENYEIIIATGNQNKVREYREILEPLGFSLKSMKEEGIVSDVEENGQTFEENSLIKAKGVASKTNKIVIADDSGLCIEALDNFPGIRSARFMENRPYSEKHQAILKMLEDKDNKNAYFVCAITVINNGKVNQFVGRVDGTIVSPRSKGNGFGYDPIFLPNGYSLTFGEMDEDEKNKISHRGRASEKLIEYFGELSKKI
jgi:XTP/dITP diphosphohydrolase